MDKIEFRKEIEIRYDVDVFVAGGGPAGVAAAELLPKWEPASFWLKRDSALAARQLWQKCPHLCDFPMV